MYKRDEGDGKKGHTWIEKTPPGADPEINGHNAIFRCPTMYSIEKKIDVISIVDATGRIVKNFSIQNFKSGENKIKFSFSSNFNLL